MIETTVIIPSIIETTVVLRGVRSLQGDRIVTVDTLDIELAVIEASAILTGQDIGVPVDSLNLLIQPVPAKPALALHLDTPDLSINAIAAKPAITVKPATLGLSIQPVAASASVAGQPIAVQVATPDLQITPVAASASVTSQDITVQVATLDLSIQPINATAAIDNIIATVDTLDIEIAVIEASASVTGQDISVQAASLDLQITAVAASAFVGIPSTFEKLVATSSGDPNFDTPGHSFVDNRGLWEYRPPNFNPANKYPCIIAMHGAGEPGDGGEEDLDLLIQTGMGEVIHTNKSRIDEKYPGYVILVPQSFTWSWPTSAGAAFLMAAVNRSYIDETRIILTGLSAGGYGIHSLAADATYTQHIYAAFPISTRWPSAIVEDMPNALHIPFWYFHGTADGTTQSYAQIRADIEAFNALGPAVPAILTGLVGLGHTEAVWNNVYDHDAQGFDQVVEKSYEVLFDQDIVDWINGLSAAPGVVQVDTLDLQIAPVDASASVAGQDIIVQVATLDMEIAAIDATAEIAGISELRVLIDFGMTNNQTEEPYEGNEWNNIHSDNTNKNLSGPFGPVNLVGVDGEASAIIWSQEQPGDNDFGAPNNGGSNDVGVNQSVGDYPASACNDSAFVYTRHLLPAIWLFSGFDNQKDYDVDFWGSRGAAAPRGIEISMNSDFSNSQTYEAANNTDYENRASFRISGVTSQRFYLRPADGSTFGYVSVVDIKEVPPTP